MLHHWIVAREALEERSVGCDFYPPQMQTPDTCFLYTYRIPQEKWFYQIPEQYRSTGSASRRSTVNLLSSTSGAGRPGRGRTSTQQCGLQTHRANAWRNLRSRRADVDPENGRWDMAFVLTTPSYDYGDAPDAGYRTLLVNDGARRHLLAQRPVHGRVRRHGA